MDYLIRPGEGLRGRAIATCALLAFAGTAVADSVLLRSTDGTVKLEGELISFNDGHYFLQTPLGDLRVAADQVSCYGDACPNFGTIEADITIGGSDTVAKGLMPLLLEGFATTSQAESKAEAARDDTEFATTLIGQDGFGEKIGTFLVQSGSSDDAFTKLQEKSAQIGLSSRRITPDEAKALSATGAGNLIDPSQEHIVAIDSLSIVVNAANPVSAISVADLAAIYTGRISNWSEIGGANLAIMPVTLTDDAATAVFDAGVYGDDARPQGITSFEAGDNVAAANFVNENPGAIAYVGFAFKRGQKPLTLVSECGIGTTPDAFSVKTEEYSLFRRLYMYNRSDMDSALAQKLIDFATSDDATNVIVQSGFIDLSVEKIAQGTDGARATRIRNSGSDSFENGFVNKMINLMGTTDRLSSTFRFRTGSSRLDPRGQRDLVRLANYLENLPNGAKVMFVGFADSVGAFEPNISLSQARAGEVQKALVGLAGSRLSNISFDAIGFGEVAPSACNNSNTGRAINRRVETWVTLP